MKSENSEIEVAEEVVVLRRKGISQPIVANILGTDRDGSGEVKRIFLDRLIHSPTEDMLGSWNVSGAISTVLEAR